MILHGCADFIVIVIIVVTPRCRCCLPASWQLEATTLGTHERRGATMAAGMARQGWRSNGGMAQTRDSVALFFILLVLCYGASRMWSLLCDKRNWYIFLFKIFLSRQVSKTGVPDTWAERVQLKSTPVFYGHGCHNIWRGVFQHKMIFYIL